MSIPRIIHQIWLGSEIPVKFMSDMADWQLMNEDWKYVLWTEPLHQMQNEDLYWNAGLYVKPHSVWQMRADIMRYEVLHRHGGFYVDTDTRPLRPLGEVFEGLTEFAVAEDSQWVGNTYLAAEPEHPVLEQIIDNLPRHADQYHNAGASTVSGPQYITPYWLGAGCYVDERTNLWFPYSWHHVRKYQEKRIAIPEDAYAEHLWSHSQDLRKRTDRAVRLAKKEEQQ